MNIAEAKKVLKEAGFQVNNLWSIYDVKSKYDCTDKEAMELIEDTMDNDSLKEDVWEIMDVFADVYGFSKIDEDE